jgi:hypothetical protein
MFLFRRGHGPSVAEPYSMAVLLSENTPMSWAGRRRHDGVVVGAVTLYGVGLAQSVAVAT